VDEYLPVLLALSKMDGVFQGLYSKRYLEGQLAVALAGRVVEEMVFGAEEVTTGASGDLQQVQNIARRMVTQWGYAKDKLGAVAWEMPDGNGGFGPRAASPEMEEMIDQEVKLLVADAYKVCKDTMNANRPLVEDLTEMLIEKETVDYKELEALITKYHPDGIPGLTPAVAA
jgi:cell division protease FtsH